jgi:pSer/pThr/pTyr-binding forkhead associated (FHA) protein
VVPDPQVPRGQVKVGYAVLNRTVNWTPALIIDGRRISLKTGVTTVGRDESADIAIDDRGLSRIHFEIAWNGEVAAIRDRQSTNGTFLDDARISEVVLRSGNVIKAGRSEFEFELSANAQVDA